MRDAAILKAEKDHDGPGNHSQRTKPVDGLQSLTQRCLRRVNVEEEENDDEGQAIEWKVDPETPPAAISMRRLRASLSRRTSN